MLAPRISEKQSREAFGLCLRTMLIILLLVLWSFAVPASSSNFEKQLEAAVQHLGFPGFSDVLLQEEDELVMMKVQQVLTRAGMLGYDGAKDVVEPDFEDASELTYIREDELQDSDLEEKEISPRHLHHPHRRSSCPGGVGSYGFNTFNFLTFALQVFNGILNVVNNINNNNNNNNLNTLNSIAVNTDQVATNSNSANNVLVMIEPPRRRRRELPSCDTFDRSAATLHAASALISLLQEFTSTQPDQEAVRACISARRMAATAGLGGLLWRHHRVSHRMDTFPCEFLFR
ncbi:hypothetical protein E2C01_093490 [Portunus trituberculatus]|uniref:Uncharacterized protein n=1 Tax=Portunus trituberculatus TaxID=210409 RepID=A0A5B7JYE3_PORTR|nr:hypothetical protein [Portunus trituberculatus]